MDKKDLEKLPRKPLLPGYESGRYEPVRQYDRSELKGEFREEFRGELRKPPLEDPVRRDNRVSVRISGQDMSRLHRIALTEGLPLQSLLASIVHRYVSALEGGQQAGTNAISSALPLSVDASDVSDDIQIDNVDTALAGEVLRKSGASRNTDRA